MLNWLKRFFKIHPEVMICEDEDEAMIKVVSACLQQKKPVSATVYNDGTIVFYDVGTETEEPSNPKGGER